MHPIVGKTQPYFMFKWGHGLEMRIHAVFVFFFLPSTEEITEIENNSLWFGHFVLHCQTRDDDRFDFQKGRVVERSCSTF